MWQHANPFILFFIIHKQKKSDISIIMSDRYIDHNVFKHCIQRLFSPYNPNCICIFEVCINRCMINFRIHLTDFFRHIRKFISNLHTFLLFIIDLPCRINTSLAKINPKEIFVFPRFFKQSAVKTHRCINIHSNITVGIP